MTEALLGVKDAATQLKLHPQTVRMMAKRGKIGHSQAGLYSRYKFRQSDLDAWVNKNRVEASQ